MTQDKEKDVAMYFESATFMLGKLADIADAINLSSHTSMWYLIRACFYKESSLKRLNIFMQALLAIELEEANDRHHRNPEDNKDPVT
jgi:hypothetical protein